MSNRTTTSIRINEATFEAAGMRMDDNASDKIEAMIFGETGTRARASWMGGHTTIEVETDSLIATVKVLRENHLL